MKSADFESAVLPFEKRLTDDLNQLSSFQKEQAENFLNSLGEANANAFLKSMTPEKLALHAEIFEERKKNRLAIARWNYIAKSIKYSFISLICSMGAGYLIGYFFEWKMYDDLMAYVGEDWQRGWFFALFLGSAHNVYDSIMLQRAIKKIREFTTKWLKKWSKKSAKKAAKTSSSS